jgi:subtilisin family serine protease
MKCELLDPTPRQHGTLTSCLVVGDGTGGTITGAAPRAKLMGLRGLGSVYSAARVFEYALEEGADVLTMSFSIPDLGDTRGLWRLMAEHATCAGMVLVSGAGNFGKGSRQPAKLPVQIRIPEGIPCVVCSGAVNRKRNKVPPLFSQGPVEWGNVRFYEDFKLPKGLIKPDVVAHPGPGLALVSSSEDSGYLPKNNGRRGNSLTAPQVAGVCALILSAAPETNAWRVKELLEETARDIKPRGKDNATGAGFLDAHAAVKKALGK